MRINITLCLGLLAVANSNVHAQNTSTYTNNTVDNQYVWFEQGANASNPTTGLPHAGIVHPQSSTLTPTSTADANSTFLFQPYSGNNVLLLQKPSDTGLPRVTAGTMTFVTPTPANSLAFASSSGFGPTYVSITVHFSGEYPDITTSLTSSDWGPAPDNSSVISVAGGRILRGVNMTPASFQPSFSIVYESVVNLGLAAPRTVTSVDFSFLSSALPGDLSRAVIFGISTSPTAAGPYSYAELTPSSFNADVVVEASAIAEAVPEPLSLPVIVLMAVPILARKRSIRLLTAPRTF